MPESPTDPWKRRVARTREALGNAAEVISLAQIGQRLLDATSAEIAIVTGSAVTRSASRIGILSGSFNPLTNAHVALGNAAIHAGGLDALVWCCAVSTIDKEGVTRAALADRVVQLRCYAAYEQHSAVAVVNRGLYVEQAALVRGYVAGGAEVAVIVGFDKAAQIFDPRYYANRDAALTELFALARLMVAPRDEHDMYDLRLLLARPENVAFAARVDYLPLSPDIRAESSTEARTLASGAIADAEMERLRSLLPPEGLALATTDRPYAQAANEAEDAYLWRSRWVAELARHTAAPVQSLPTLRSLVQASVRTDDLGVAVRRCLLECLDSTDSDALLRAIRLAGSTR